ncbi:PQ loop repeat-domain-containing protein [Xylariaceae sp. FL0255]|nr:PQ loop repeat-domain-containing protein [Xylariaceae sp. FL0255]
MAPQTRIPLAADVLGLMGTILWCTQLIPQIWTNWRTRKYEGLPASMMFLWAISGVPFGIYAIVQNFNIPVQIQPQAFMLLCLISWGQILFYYHKWPLWKVLTVVATTGAVFGGVEASLIVTIKPIYHTGNNTLILVIGIAAAILLAAGLLPPYGEAWKRRGRIQTFDVLGGVMYLVCILLEIGIFSSNLIWLFRTRRIRKQAKIDGKTFDDVAADKEKKLKQNTDEADMVASSEQDSLSPAADVELGNIGEDNVKNKDDIPGNVQC